MVDEKIDESDRFFLHVLKHIKLMLHSNTFWLVIAWMSWEFASNVDKQWLAEHEGVKVWLPSVMAAIAVLVKALQNMSDSKPVSSGK